MTSIQFLMASGASIFNTCYGKLANGIKVKQPTNQLQTNIFVQKISGVSMKIQHSNMFEENSNIFGSHRWSTNYQLHYPNRLLIFKYNVWANKEWLINMFKMEISYVWMKIKLAWIEMRWIRIDGHRLTHVFRSMTIVIEGLPKRWLKEVAI